MKIDSKLLCFIIVGGMGNVALVRAPFIIQVILIPVIGGYFGYTVYKITAGKEIRGI